MYNCNTDGVIKQISTISYSYHFHNNDKKNPSNFFAFKIMLISQINFALTENNSVVVRGENPYNNKIPNSTVYTSSIYLQHTCRMVNVIKDLKS